MKLPRNGPTNYFEDSDCGKCLGGMGISVIFYCGTSFQLGLQSGLTNEVQAVIGQAAVRWWHKDMTEHSMDLAQSGTPLLAALPPGYLAELNPQQTATM